MKLTIILEPSFLDQAHMLTLGSEVSSFQLTGYVGSLFAGKIFPGIKIEKFSKC